VHTNDVTGDSLCALENAKDRAYFANSQVQHEALRHRESQENGNRHAPGDENGMNESTGALPTACELATKRCFGLSQRKESKISWPSAAVPKAVFPTNCPSA